MKTVQDPAFLREANKLDLEVVEPFSGEKVEKMVRNYLATDPKILERVARLLSGKPKRTSGGLRYTSRYEQSRSRFGSCHNTFSNRG